MVKQEKKSRYLAGISLAVMGAGFLMTIPFHDSFWGRLLQGGFEAGLVGGLADWFAVTALFRHPLGIPIPHTALLPNNRDRVTRSLTRMIEEEWLTKESIMGKISQIQFTERVLQIIESELGKSTVKKALQTLISEAVKAVDTEKLAPPLEKELKSYMSSVDAGSVIEKATNHILEKKYDEKAMDHVLEELGKWAAKDESKLALGKMGKQLIETTEADGLLKFAIQSFSQLVNEEKIGQMLQTFIQNRIRNVSKHDNAYRQLILERTKEEITNLPARQDLMADINEWKGQVVEGLEISGQIQKFLESAKGRLLSVIEGESFVLVYVNPVICRFIDSIKANEERITLIEEWVHKQVVDAIEKNHSKIGRLVKENLDKYDTETLIDMMENNIGKDLQWIRVNGAVCGFFIGLVLTVFKTFF
ncbi:DUF445 domain-containing protein [Mesobacillus zeae]|uniref:DUF445 domain-containing protein n=1 Tax=Mesobacillus zeae TaxID=1917180 RepID=A0A398BK08_9BACI|nr:DUF445 domain-containing protein [Mesobacillus zeae]RID88818.1 DUF445 domain-containing protein [Mesobacillus zeae]